MLTNRRGGGYTRALLLHFTGVTPDADPPTRCARCVRDAQAYLENHRDCV
jgi:hypothetical protein